MRDQIAISRVIPLPGDPHRQTRDLLSWYINATLDVDEVAIVEMHLNDCCVCRAELAAEQRIEVNASKTDAACRKRKSDAERNDTPSAYGQAASHTRIPSVFRRSVPVSWVLTGQVATVLVVAGGMLLAQSPPQVKPLYHTLSAAPVAAPGNVLVIFRPDTEEKSLRAILVASEARLVDGPTTSDAYVLHVADARRDAALTQLRADKRVLLAEPVDTAEPK